MSAWVWRRSEETPAQFLLTLMRQIEVRSPVTLCRGISFSRTQGGEEEGGGRVDLYLKQGGTLRDGCSVQKRVGFAQEKKPGCFCPILGPPVGDFETEKSERRLIAHFPFFLEAVISKK